MEGDIRFDEILNPKWAFQSTPSAWRETESRGVLSVSERFQSTPSAWRETFRLRTSLDHQHISIHSLRMEGDSENLFAAVCRNDISIHSLRMEGDHFIGCAVCIDCISIHSLRMEGDGRGSPGIPVPHWISIHSLRMEGDPDGLHLPRSIRNFNPLPPHGGRR